MPQFNIRVYGILTNENKQVLVSDEIIRGNYYTKFPGGGLEFGEGTRDCLVREFLEEVNLKIEVGSHIYTTDFFQLSAFHPDHQIISVYYHVKPLHAINIPLATKPFDFDLRQPGEEEDNELVCFRFIDWDKLTEDALSLPIDKKVVAILKNSG